LGVDAEARFWANSLATGWFTHVWDSDSLRDGQAAGHLGLRLQNDRAGVQTTFTSVGTNYAPALGFVRRQDMLQYTGRLHYGPLIRIPSMPFVRRILGQVDAEYITGQDGDVQTTFGRALVRADFNQRDLLQVYVERQFDRLEGPFPIRPDAVIPAGDYAFVTAGLYGETDSSRPISAGAGASTGGFYDGSRTDVNAHVSWRQSQHLVLDAGVDHSWIDLPVDNGAFTATALSMSALGAINRDLFARALIQYDTFSRDVQANVRVNWIHTPGSDLFLVFNTAHHFYGAGEDRFDPRLNSAMVSQLAVVKVTYLVML
jgi:hypothetical protein